MQCIGRVIHRHSAARAFIAGAAILAGAAAPAAQGRNSVEDMAMAVPQVSPMGAGGVALPRPLPPSEALRVRAVFDLQRRADPAAVAEAALLPQTLLLGHIVADRLTRAGTAAPMEQLGAWLVRYPDLPDAPAIYSLLLAQLPKGATLPPPPPAVPTLAASTVLTPPDDGDLAGRALLRNPELDRSVMEPARAGQPRRAVHLIAHASGVDRLYGAVLRAEVAQALFTQGRDIEAYNLAEAANHQAKGEIGLAPYIAGLAAWRLNRADLARPMFAAAYQAPLTNTNRRSAAAYWAARAEMRCHNLAGYAPWMQRAAENPRAFYGLIARRALGLGTGTLKPFSAGTLGEADVEAVAAMPGGRRAFALLQVGEPARAEAELRQLWAATQDRAGFTRSILLIAQAAGLNELAAQLMPMVQTVGEGAAIRLPTANFRPTGGFRIDPALMYGLARLESNFNPDAISPAGARGLMQIMPITAETMKQDGAEVLQQVKLRDPATNLDLGQRYLLRLARYDIIKNDLIRLLASYNAGPASLARWAGDIRHMGDPLLFMESIPNEETRAYIPQALTYTWLYAAQLGLPAPTLDEMAAGAWPQFEEWAPGREAPRGLVAQIH